MLFFWFCCLWADPSSGPRLSPPERLTARRRSRGRRLGRARQRCDVQRAGGDAGHAPGRTGGGARGRARADRDARGGRGATGGAGFRAAGDAARQGRAGSREGDGRGAHRVFRSCDRDRVDACALGQKARPLVPPCRVLWPRDSVARLYSTTRFALIREGCQEKGRTTQR